MFNFNYYEGWTEAQLLEERLMVQRSLAPGRTTEARLANELTRNQDPNSTPLETTLERIAYALYLLAQAGETATDYPNPYATSGVTRQQFC